MSQHMLFNDIALRRARQLEMPMEQLKTPALAPPIGIIVECQSRVLQIRRLLKAVMLHNRVSARI